MIIPEEPRWELAVYDRILGMMVERAVYDMQSENVSEEEIEAAFDRDKQAVGRG